MELTKCHPIVFMARVALNVFRPTLELSVFILYKFKEVTHRVTGAKI